MVAIFMASSVPDPPIPQDVPDVSLHIPTYFGFTLVVIRAFSGGAWSGVTLRTLGASWIFAVAYALTDEWHQSFVPNRFAEWRDVGSDAIGAFAAAVVVKAWGIIRRL
jgi:VanZ family protein